MRVLPFLLVASLGVFAPASGQRTFTNLPITFHVPQTGDEPLVDEGWLSARLTRANEIFAPHHISFSLQRTIPLAEEHRRLETRADRDRLRHVLQRGTIDCYLVQSLKDVDTPDRFIRGVHWRARPDRSQHYIILSMIGGPGVLAHELGHYLGNAQHRWIRGNVMSYDWGANTPTFESDQVLRMQRFIRSAVRRGHLVPVE